MTLALIDKHYSYYFDDEAIIYEVLDDLLYHLALCEDGSDGDYDWDTECVEDLKGYLFHMHCAIYDIRLWWKRLCDRFAAAVLLDLPVRKLENYDEIVTASLFDDPVVELIGEDIREVESRVSEMMRNRIFPAPDPLSWEFPTDLVYIITIIRDTNKTSQSFKKS